MAFKMSYAWTFSFTLVTLVEICGVTGRFQYFYSLINGFISISLEKFVLSQKNIRPSLIERNLLRKIQVHSSKKWYTPLVHKLVWNELSLGWIFRNSKCSYGLDQLGPNNWRLEVSKNIKYILLASRISELQLVKVGAYP